MVSFLQPKEGSLTVNSDFYRFHQENSKVRDNLRDTFIKLKKREGIMDFCIIDINESREVFKVEKNNNILVDILKF